MKPVCPKCSTETMCPQCNHDNFNQPLVLKYFDQVMPIIIFSCSSCNVELFRSMTYENKTLHENFCIACASKLADEARQYRVLIQCSSN